MSKVLSVFIIYIQILICDIVVSFFQMQLLAFCSDALLHIITHTQVAEQMCSFNTFLTHT
jgi:hypothetical protein